MPLPSARSPPALPSRSTLHCARHSPRLLSSASFLAPHPPGLGVYYGVREACRNPDVLAQTGLSEGLKDKRIVVQGFGNGALSPTGRRARLALLSPTCWLHASRSPFLSPPLKSHARLFPSHLPSTAVGYHSALFFQQKGGAQIIAIAERDGYIRKDDGIDVEALKEHFDSEGTILGFDGAETHVRCWDGGVTCVASAAWFSCVCGLWRTSLSSRRSAP